MGNIMFSKYYIFTWVISIMMIGSIYMGGGLLTSSMDISELRSLQLNFHPIGDAPSFNGSTLYVGGSGPGNYSSIQDAIDNASDGDIIYVYSGVYQENIQINKSVYLKGENKDTTVIDGRNLDNTVTILVDPVYISNFTITNGSYYGIMLDNARCNLISNVIIHNNSDSGIYARSSFDCEIKNSSISNNDYGVYLNVNSRNFSISNNNITLNNLRGIFLINSYNITIENNSITNNEDGIGIFSSWNNNIIYNQILNNCDYGMRIKNSTYNLIKSNTIIYGGYGIYIFDNSDYNTIIGNTIKPDFYHHPVAIDDSAWTSSDSPVLINILRNDYDLDGRIDKSTVSINTLPHHGTAVVESNGSIIYTPTSGFNGNDTFTYTVRDNENIISNIAHVNIYVKQANASAEEVDQQQTVYNYDLQIYDIKKAAQIFYSNSTTLTKIDVYLRRQGIPPDDITLEIRKNNVSGTTLATYTISSYNVHLIYSWITFDFPDISVDKDATYAIVLYTSGGNNDNCYMWGYGDDLYSNGSLWFGESGRGWKPLKNNDGCFKTYRSIGSSPITANDTYETNEETTITVEAPGVLGNDIDPDNGPNPIIAVLENTVTNGSLTFYSNGSFRYTPDVDFIGVDGFTYKAYDGLTYSNITTVTINVTYNTGQTIRIENTLQPSINNKIYHNNLYRGYKISQVYDSCTNTWDNGYPSGGNYWSNYNEPSEGAYDNDSDSIIDTPYDIYGHNNRDNYPLLYPWATSPPTANFTWSPLHPDTLDNIGFIDLSTDSGNGTIVSW
ncbi:MAG TPA: tandem-95 repeat protein, partial [Thermoplasmatales archaeon]|nr:tandem-95 repeat protein [Thermoplasmatales archaeon]